ncbi:MAG: hypothetical protein HC933_07745 [Pleurocapsa sp. SU_196_0]|nr:hypothetical protein [Pleurocapsa sp. SU_196_0]
MLDHLDAVHAAPDHHKVLFENHRVRVLETVLRPGEETAVHTHVWSGVLYIISWSDFERYDEHRNVVMDSARLIPTPIPGTVVPATPFPPHSLKNVGTELIHVILTEFKEPEVETLNPSSLSVAPNSGEATS